jgi:hypothetical protein
MTSSLVKIIITVWLALVLFLPEGVVYTWLKMKQKEIRREVKMKIHSGLEKEDLIRFSFHIQHEKSAVTWIKKGEFSYKNNLFDVVFTETSVDSVIYYCWQDHEESAIKKELQKLSAMAWGNHPERRDGHKKAIDFYKQLFCEKFKTSVYTLRHPEQIEIPIRNIHNYTSVFIYSESPPPEYTNSQV